MKKYLFIALALLGMASCAKDDLNAGNKPNHNGEIEESYIAINLMAADSDTRAINDDPYGNADEYGYEQGTTAERVVNTAYFFFFDAQGEPFNVVAEQDNPATAPGGSKNHLPLAISNAQGNTENVSDIKNAVLILSTYKGVYPSQIVAVINWTPTENTYTLTQLHEKLAELGNDTDGYVMSNSVYMDGANKMVDAVPLTAANIKTSSEEAIAAPINIYVERIAAKVVLTASGKVAGTTNIFDTQKNSSAVGTLTSLNDVDVYVQLHGWELYNDYTTSNLLKNIENWDIATLGLTWNDIPYYRCYWAESQDTAINDSFSWEYKTPSDKGFPTAYGFNVASSANYTDGSTYTYCGENTNQVVLDGEGKVTSDLRTKVILKGQLMQKISETTYEPLELARWYGTEYAGKDALKIAVANSLKYILYYYDTASGKQVSIEPGDLECIWGGDVDDPKAKAYEVYFQLSTTGENKTWSQYSSEHGYTSFGDVANGVNTANTNAYLMGVEPALLYTEGQTYYIVDIEHLGTAGAKYGVVRNHVYQIDINSIKGYGSPVYIGTSNIVTPPDYPTEDESSYVAAKINVLSWKVVKQRVDIKQ